MVAFLMTRNNSNVNILKITWELMVGCDYILVFLVEQESNYFCEMEIKCKFTRIVKSQKRKEAQGQNLKALQILGLSMLCLIPLDFCAELRLFTDV